MAQIIKERLVYYRHTLQLDVDEDEIYRSVEKDAMQDLDTIMANMSEKALSWFSFILNGIFSRIYKQMVVNENQVERIRKLVATRKGPVIFCPTHRSYMDFLIVSLVLYGWQILPPHIVAGEDLMHIKGVSHVLRYSGALFMRRSLKGDDLYKAIFSEYIKQLAKDYSVMEFFIEGTRSRVNKMLTPKFGILNFINKSYFDKDVEEVTFVPVSINYTRVLEGESFPGELTG